MLCGHAVPFSETWPTSGMTRNGRLYPRQTLALPTAGNGSSSSPGLLPTPLVTNRAGMSPSRSSIDGKRGADLGPVIGALLKTPTAQLATNGGSQDPEKRKAGGHGPTLADQVEHQLLPTPRATDGTKGGPNRRGSSGDLMLPSAVMDLLPTPAARDWKSGQSNLIGTNARPLNEVVEMLLPTPTARLGDDTSRGADPARYKGPQSLNGRRSNLDDCIAAVETKAPWLGETTHQPSKGGKPSSAAQHPGQLSLDGPENDSPPPSSSS